VFVLDSTHHDPVKFLAFSPGKVGSLSAYLPYLFLRFPGTLGPEVAQALECFDTYDRKWTAQRRVWIGRGEGLTLVAPPALFPLETDRSLFGLQTPVSLGKVRVKVRSVLWGSGLGALEGQVVTVGRESFLILKETGDSRALTDALEADGLRVLSGTEGWWVRDKPSGFLEPGTVPEAGPHDSAPGFLVAHLNAGLRMARLYEKGIRDDIDTECLHQYRVHLRRIRSLTSLGLFWQVLPEGTRLKNLLRLLQQKTNELRDLDVLLLDLPGLRGLMPWNEGVELETWKASLEHRRRAEFRRVKAWLASEEYQGILEEVGRLLDDLTRYSDPCTMAEWSQGAFGRTARSLRRVLKALGPESPDEALHEIRIRGKKLRYVLDTLGYLAPRAAVKSLTSRLKQAQEGLGAFQDRSILLDRLKAEIKVLRSGPSTIDPLALGILIGTLAAGHQAQRAKALDDARTLASPSFRKILDQLGSPVPSDGP